MFYIYIKVCLLFYLFDDSKDKDSSYVHEDQSKTSLEKYTTQVLLKKWIFSVKQSIY